MFPRLKHYLTTLNIFPSVPPSTDEHELRTQRISTRLFIFLLIVLMTILLFYTSLVKVTKTVNVYKPPLAQYEQLYATYSQALTCPILKYRSTTTSFFVLTTHCIKYAVVFLSIKVGSIILLHRLEIVFLPLTFELQLHLHFKL